MNSRPNPNNPFLTVEKPGDEKASGLLSPLGGKTVVERIVDRLLQAIMEGELSPGQKIPTEMELCESLRVGRNSVREAIKVLVSMGVLSIRRSEGTFVTEGFSERMLDPMLYSLILAGGDSFAVIELRQLFETGVLRIAMGKRTDDDLRMLEAVYGEMEDLVRDGVTEEELLDIDIRFHRVLTAIVKNPLVDKISMVIERLTLPSRAEVSRGFIERGKLAAYLAKHADIIRIIRERDDAAVARTIDEHFSDWRSFSARMRARKAQK